MCYENFRFTEPQRSAYFMIEEEAARRLVTAKVDFIPDVNSKH
jgi:hypothetical protein